MLPDLFRQEVGGHIFSARCQSIPKHILNDLAEWNELRVEVLGSERLTGAALDRRTHRCHILECNGESYRLKDAQRRRRGATATSSDKD